MLIIILFHCRNINEINFSKLYSICHRFTFQFISRNLIFNITRPIFQTNSNISLSVSLIKLLNRSKIVKTNCFDVWYLWSVRFPIFKAILCLIFFFFFFPNIASATFKVNPKLHDVFHRVVLFLQIYQFP